MFYIKLNNYEHFTLQLKTLVDLTCHSSDSSWIVLQRGSAQNNCHKVRVKSKFLPWPCVWATEAARKKTAKIFFSCLPSMSVKVVVALSVSTESRPCVTTERKNTSRVGVNKIKAWLLLWKSKIAQKLAAKLFLSISEDDAAEKEENAEVPF